MAVASKNPKVVSGRTILIPSFLPVPLLEKFQSRFPNLFAVRPIVTPKEFGAQRSGTHLDGAPIGPVSRVAETGGTLQ
jgi:hypothetical protein